MSENSHERQQTRRRWWLQVQRTAHKAANFQAPTQPLYFHCQLEGFTSQHLPERATADDEDCQYGREVELEVSWE